MLKSNVKTLATRYYRDVFTLREIPYEEILRFWKETLWSERVTKIEPMSAMLLAGGYDPTISGRFEPTFFGVFDGPTLIAANSGHRSSPEHYRSRGLFVAKPYRRQGLALRLFEELQKTAKNEGATTLWSYPRESAIAAYRAYGFTPCTEWQRDADTPLERHCYVRLPIQ